MNFPFPRFAAMLVLTGCALLTAMRPAHAQTFPMGETLPRVNGSTSTNALGQLLAARAAGLDVQLRRVNTSYRPHSPGQIEVTLPLQYEAKNFQLFSRLKARNYHTGTHKAYEALIAGKSDLILVARPPSASESAEAKKGGINFEMRPVALDAFVMIANAKNPVKGLTTAQLRSIYTGQTRLWRQVGGPDLPIRAFTRPRDSGSEELLDQFVLRGVKGMTLLVQNRLSEMGEVIQRVAENRDAIGYSVFYFEEFMMPDTRLKLLAINGVLPSRASIGDKSYPYTAPVLCVTRSDAKPTSATSKLRDWLLTAEGQQLVAQSGCVPINEPKASPATP